MHFLLIVFFCPSAFYGHHGNKQQDKTTGKASQHLAVLSNNVKIVELLAKNEIFGFQSNMRNGESRGQETYFCVQDKEGKTAYHYACEKGNLEIVKLLLGVDDNEKSLAKGTTGLL